MSLPRELCERHERPFEWGVSDCVVWARDALAIIAGREFTLPNYHSHREAYRMIRAAGSLEALVTAELGEIHPPETAGFGDIALAAFPEQGEVLGVADPPVFWLRAEGGFMPVELTLATGVWPCRKARL